MKTQLTILLVLLCSRMVLAQPANDNCSGALSITPNGACLPGTTVAANDSWQGSVGCQTGGTHPDVWYRFTATGSQAQINVTTSAPWTGNVELILVEGTCSSLTLIGYQCGPSPMTATFNGLQTGSTYFYTISNTNTGTPGPFQTCLLMSSPPPVAGQDCSSAAILCNSTQFSQPTSSAGFGTQEVSPSNSCWVSGGERQSKWFKFTVGCQGTLEFNITPVKLSDDYDWAIWDVSGNPTGCTTKGNAIACNWSACTGSTGLSSCPSSEPGGSSSGPGCAGNFAAWVNTTTGNFSPITVTAGHTYALLVDNFTTSNSGFTLTFGGACNGGTAKLGPDATFTYSAGSCGAYTFTKSCPTTNSTFLWQFGDGTSATTQNATHTYSTFGNFVISLTVTDALGCVSTYSQTINIVATPLPTVTTPVTYCVGATASPLTAIGTSLLWYTSATGGTGSTTAPTPSTATAGTTSYYVSQTIAGCESLRAQIDVIVNPVPTVAVNSQSICQGQSTILTATPSIPGGSFSWSPGGQTTASIPVSPSTTTTYTVTYNLNGCSNTGSGVVTVNPAPTVTVNSPNICAGQSTTLTATPSTGGGTFLWFPGGQTSASITVSPTTTTNYTVTYSLNGCSNTGMGTVTVTAAFTVAVNSVNICAGQSATLTATPSVGGGTYSWSPGGQTTSSITVSPATTTNYTVTYNLNGCSVPATGTVTVTAAPTVTVNSPNICAGQSATLTATPSVGGGSYSWSPGGQTTASITVSPASTTNYTVTYNLNGCTNTGTGTVTVNSFTPSVSITATTTTTCSGSPITFTATPTNGGSSPSYQWQINGVNTGTNSSTFTTSSLANGDQVSVIMTSNQTCITIPTATSNVITISTTSVTPSVSISASSTSICTGGSVTFTATPLNGGSSPLYQWQINGVNAGTNSSTFTTSSLVNGDQVSVVMTSNASCTTTSTATSNAITITTSSVTPSVSISASSTSICSGGTVSFTATPTNGGSGPSYQWQVNGVNAGTNAPSFTTSSLADGDQVTVIMTSNANCTTTPTATSNPITITTNSVTPSVTITASSTSICSGSSVTFTAVPINGGSSPSYQWQINGANTGTNSSTFTSSSLNDGDQVTVIMTSNASCASTPTATSNVIGITANSVTPSVSIGASSTTICSGSSVTFTATPTNGGLSPSYQWLINGVNAGTNSSTFTSNSLTDGDQVSVVMTSNASCITTPTATSNIITITTSSVVTSVSITASSTSICSGSSVTFTATPTNGGSSPVYQWQINGVNAGTNSPTFTTSSLANGDQISVIMTSNVNCASNPTATSNIVTVTAGSVTPAVSITASSTSICTGASISFTASPTNGGTSPVYQWQINGVNTGTNSPTFSTNSLSNGDQVSVILTSNASCTTIPTATSNVITINTSSVTPSVSIATSSSSICSGSSTTFTATPVNEGTTPTYQWEVNGQPVPGQTSSSFTTTNLSNGDIVTIKMSSSEPCASPATVTSNGVTINVTPVPVGIRYPTVTATSNVPQQLHARANGNNDSYQWAPATGLNSPAIKDPVFNYDKETEYVIQITSDIGCLTVDTLLVKIIYVPAVFVPNAWTPNGDGHNDYLFPLTINVTELKYFRIFNRWGQKVFETNIIGQGWDGNFQGKPQPMDVYNWTVEAIVPGGVSYKRSGSAVLLR